MVRWVFRPYTQIRRAICTLASRRTSTRVSPGFILPKYSSPSFGSSSIYSNFEIFKHTKIVLFSNQVFIAHNNRCRVDNHLFHFRSGSECLFALILAYKWDSLVRVSRRVNLIVSEKHTAKWVFSFVCRVYLQFIFFFILTEYHKKEHKKCAHFCNHSNHVLKVHKLFFRKKII